MTIRYIIAKRRSPGCRGRGVWSEPQCGETYHPRSMTSLVLLGVHTRRFEQTTLPLFRSLSSSPTRRTRQTNSQNRDYTVCLMPPKVAGAGRIAAAQREPVIDTREGSPPVFPAIDIDKKPPPRMNPVGFSPYYTMVPGIEQGTYGPVERKGAAIKLASRALEMRRRLAIFELSWERFVLSLGRWGSQTRRV